MIYILIVIVTSQFIAICIFYFMKCTMYIFFFFQAEDGIRDYKVTGVQTCALPISAAQMRTEELDARMGKDPIRVAPEDEDGLRDAVERRGPHPWIVAGDEVLEQGADGRRGKMAAHVPLEEPREARRPRIPPRRQLAGALGASAESVGDRRARLAGEGRTSRRKPYHRGDALGVGRGGVQGQRASQGVPDEDRRRGKPLEHGPDRRILLEDGGRLFSRREPIAAVARQVQHQHTPDRQSVV